MHSLSIVLRSFQQSHWPHFATSYSFNFISLQSQEIPMAYRNLSDELALISMRLACIMSIFGLFSVKHVEICNSFKGVYSNIFKIMFESL